MSATRIIKKYPNRRLYDTEDSKYITLDDVKKLVLNGVDFIVKDVKTEEDLTRNILLQIISEQEHDGEPFFSTELLIQIIRSYRDSLQSMAGDYIEKSMQLFVEQQKQFQEAMSSNPLTAMSELTDKNLKMWQEMQNNLFKAAGLKTDNNSK
ncbi:MAG: polyhydroxyalkanoate synthesis repressor PhaR [Gammaproteobacteria bacterium RIFCSPLOWO2_02_FULL_47_50]|nr:MAG: polyhydroxyalkanoate synthesis repressor PhaR [Gammaproteobacteria bacterium RIFCSPLOWO2_02_47_7]OGT66584.1 MAG: polyhydroxyalkanoate synthesis repressor PhaR [Gammaproteobacteria bacterium RIFCSPLOWO2_01_FULL_47_190]OGT72189.1 MAG: polyhydroxyalkanoate synthesis repressor PhaR [Gammaproteobacteria bacterium RIFCSPLOWO2_12_47_11]OGT78553.1 MAG: polyhydroxyalkanoate synthesis repressor PhaR [Gammaproteobacteria bacterium RIFCSPLOWO2_02_FULL_47_50]OGT83433.1 MAG: polyhydroxyalkanoate synt